MITAIIISFSIATVISVIWINLIYDERNKINRGDSEYHREENIYDITSGVTNAIMSEKEAAERVEDRADKKDLSK